MQAYKDQHLTQSVSLSTCTAEGEGDLDTVPALDVDTAPAPPPGAVQESQSMGSNDRHDTQHQPEG